MKIFKLLSISFASFALFAVHPQAQAQDVTATNLLQIGPLQTLESYLVNNDPSYHNWDSNHFTLWQAAALGNISGVPGESSIGNDIGLELPVHDFVKSGFFSDISLDSATRFQALFGGVAAQQFGLAYNYNANQVQLTFGLDARYDFAAHQTLAVPFLEFKKGSTQLYGLSPVARFSIPLGSRASIEGDVGLSISF